MNEQERAELGRLRSRQEALQRQLATLNSDIQHLAARLEEPLRAGTEAARTETPPPLPPVISHAASKSVEKIWTLEDRETSGEPVAVPVSHEAFDMKVRIQRDGSIQPLIVPAPSASAAPSAPRETFEMKVGTYWLVRVGIVMLLTGLVFLGTYAYKNYIGKLGPAGKVTLLYAASAALLGLGGWLQRKREKESLRNYGQVLFAGGLAAVYFTTYAAHYVELLRVIASPVVAALLLLGWAAGTVWLADRRQSEVLALFAVGLAYYTSVITDVGFFTLGSNLVLTAAAVVFLVRNRWTTLSFISVVATYGGFAFWRFHHGDWGWDARTGDLMPANLFLAGYWIFFTAAVFLSRGATLVNANRALFASLNNGAFFALILLSMIHSSQGNFWKFALIYGTTLLGAALLARRVLPDEPIIKNTYLTQGLTLVTVGFIACFSGLKLALVLAAESVVLTVLGHQQKNLFVRAGGYLTAALSAIWIAGTVTGNNPDVLLGSVIGAALLFNAWWEHRLDVGRGGAVLRPGSGCFAVLAIGVWAVVTWHAVPGDWVPVAWMIEAVLLTALFYLVRVPEVPLVAQGLAVAAQGFWFFEFALRPNRPHWLVPATLVGGTLALSHWWQKQKPLAVRRDLGNVLQIVYGLALVGVLFFWFKPDFAPAAWLVFLSGLAIGVTIYGVTTRAWALAACAQIFLIASSVALFEQFGASRPPWLYALVPLVAWLVLGIATTAWLAHHDTSDTVRGPLLRVSVFYRAVAFVMMLWWVFEYVPVPNQFWTLALLGLVVLAVAGWLKRPEPLIFSGLFLAIGLVVWSVQEATNESVVTWPNALALLALLAAQQAVRRLPQRYTLPPHVDSAAILVTGGAIWLFTSRWVALTPGANLFMTASWAALAFLLFAAGFVLRERMHRWLGLGILACAIGRVFLLDVWRLETIYRILSFMALGVVLLVLGFIYNKYQDKIRQWL